MKKTTSLVAIAVALSLTAGCANRRTPGPDPARAGEHDRDRHVRHRSGRRCHRHGRCPAAAAISCRASPVRRPGLLRLRFLRARRRGPRDARRPGRLAGALSDRAGHDRGPCRRARHPRIQSRARRPPRQCGARLSRVARHRAGADADDQLGQGAPGRARIQRERLGPEPPRRDGGAGVKAPPLGSGGRGGPRITRLERSSARFTSPPLAAPLPRGERISAAAPAASARANRAGRPRRAGGRAGGRRAPAGGGRSGSAAG